MVLEEHSQDNDFERLQWLYTHRDFEIDSTDQGAELCKAVANSVAGDELFALQWAISVGGADRL